MHKLFMQLGVGKLKRSWVLVQEKGKLIVVGAEIKVGARRLAI